MDAWKDRSAIITGGASGIGRALCRAAARRGAFVIVADLAEDGARRVASEIGGEARRVDVTDANAVQELVEGVARERGGLDYIFNNAGIAIFGEARDMTRDDWRAIIEVNVVGVVNGVHAAYPLMVRQGEGHIVNTASAAGLVPLGGATAYAMTKHAVVGLSTALRMEAAAFGVRVTAICPGLIETPIVGASKKLNADTETLLRELPFTLHSPDRLAEKVLRGVERNKAIIEFSAITRVLWRAYRAMPAAMISMGSRSVDSNAAMDVEGRKRARRGTSRGDRR